MYWLPYSTHTSHHPLQTPCLPWISCATKKLMLVSCKMVKKQFEAFHAFLWHFSKFKTEFYGISFFLSVLTSRLHFWNSSAVTISRVYSNCCCSCWFEPEIIKIGQSSHKIYSNNIVNFQESTTIFKWLYKKSLETYCRHHVSWVTNLRLKLKLALKRVRSILEMSTLSRLCFGITILGTHLVDS